MRVPDFKTVLKSGTLSDKISAYSVLLQEHPVANLGSLDNLIDMISLKSRRPCLLAIDALLDLFPNYLLPNDRKLSKFQEQPMKLLTKLSSGNKDARDKYLILWMFENKLKDCYKKFLVNFGNGLSIPLVRFMKKALQTRIKGSALE